MEAAQNFWYEIAALFDHPQCLLPIHYVNTVEELPTTLIVTDLHNEPLFKIDPTTGLISWNECVYSNFTARCGCQFPWFQQFLQEAKQKTIIHDNSYSVLECIDELCNRLDVAILTKTSDGKQAVQFAYSAVHMGKFLWKARPCTTISISPLAAGRRRVGEGTKGRSLDLIHQYARTQQGLAFIPLGFRSVMTCRMDQNIRKCNTWQQSTSFSEKNDDKRMEGCLSKHDNMIGNDDIDKMEDIGSKKYVSNECVTSCLSDDSQESDAFMESRRTLRRIKRMKHIKPSDDDGDDKSDCVESQSSSLDSSDSDGCGSHFRGDITSDSEKQNRSTSVHGVSKRKRRDDIEWAWSQAKNDYSLHENDDDD